MARNLDIYNYIKDNKTYLIGLLIFTVLFMVVYSTSTSFLYDYPETSDSFVFQVIGKFWLQGAIPYRDLYDNKGPFLYAMNALGYWLTGNKTGVLLTQIPFFFATGLITFHFLQIGFNKTQSFWLSIVLLLGLSYGFNGGNNACEHSLPLLMLSFYLFYRWLNQAIEKQNSHPLRYSFIYGVSIGLCMMTRPSNAIVILLIIAYITLFLLVNKQFKNLLKNLLWIALGSLAICLPFILYFLVKDSLGDFYYALFLSNMHYLKNTGILESPMYLKRALALISSYINCLMFIPIGLLLICSKDHRKHGVIWLLMGTICILFFLRTNCYPHYAHICLPFAVIGLLELKAIYKNINLNRCLRYACYSITIFLISFSSFNGVYTLIKNAIHDDSSQKALYAAYDTIFKDIPKGTAESFACYGCLPEMLLRWNLRPCYRFFALQGFSRYYNQDVYEKTNQEFINGDAKWVLLNHWKGVPREIKEVLEEKYQPIKELSTTDGLLVLYKRKNL